MIELCYFASENMGLLLIRIAFFTGNIIFIIPPSSQLLRFFSNSSYIPRLKHAVGSFSKSQIFLLFMYYSYAIFVTIYQLFQDVESKLYVQPQACRQQFSLQVRHWVLNHILVRPVQESHPSTFQT